MSRDIAILCEGMDCNSLLSEWNWLVSPDYHAIMIGIFGDWIFGARDGSLWHLDLLEGQFHKVAEDFNEFNSRKRDVKYLDDWFSANWANIALDNGLVPKTGECLGWRVPPVLGGAFSLENIQVFSLAVYQSLTGQLFRQIAGQS